MVLPTPPVPIMRLHLGVSGPYEYQEMLTTLGAAAMAATPEAPWVTPKCLPGLEVFSR